MWERATAHIFVPQSTGIDLLWSLQSAADAVGCFQSEQQPWAEAAILNHSLNCVPVTNRLWRPCQRAPCRHPARGAEGWGAAGDLLLVALQPSWHPAGAWEEALRRAWSLLCSPTLCLCCLFFMSCRTSHVWDMKWR